MPGLKVALKSGNWSDTTLWSGGVKPAAGDTVCANGYTVVLDENINVGTLTTAAQPLTTVIPVMTGYTTPSGSVTVSSDQPAQPGWRAFDGSTALTPAWYTSNVATGWLAYEFVSPVVIDKYGMSLRGDSYDPRNWTFEAWNGASWVILHTVSSSIGSYTSPALGNTTAYSKYRYNVSANNGAGLVIVLEAYMYQQYYADTGSAGGVFIVSSSVSIAATTNGLVPGTTNLLIYTGSAGTVLSITGSITGGNGTTSGTRGVIASGSGTLNILGTISGAPNASATGQIGVYIVAGSMTTNIVGSITNAGSQATGFYSTASGSINIVGNIIGGTTNGYSTVNIGGVGSTVNITGDIYAPSSGTTGWTIYGLYIGAICSVTVTGTIYGTNSGGSGTPYTHYGVYIAAAATVNTVGNLFGSTSDLTNGSHCVAINAAAYYKHVGPVKASYNGAPAFANGNTSAINIFTGPFISSAYGTVPILAARMHYQKTTGSYYEFRNNSTTGALAPGPTASAVRLYSPDTILSAPSASDVRYGVTFASGSFTGTLRMPSASQVAYGVSVDNTTGSAVVTAGDVWNYLISNMNTTGSIGERLKNVSTVDTTGQQLTSFT